MCSVPLRVENVSYIFAKTASQPETKNLQCQYDPPGMDVGGLQ